MSYLTLFPSHPIHPWNSEHAVTWLEDESVCEEPIKTRISTIKAVLSRESGCCAEESLGVLPFILM